MRTRPLHKGTIVGLRPNKKTGIATLEIDDDRRGKVIVPCYGKPIADAFNEAFHAIVNGVFLNDAIVGEPIYYRVDELGLLCEFCPVDEKAPPELVEEYATRKPKSSYGGRGTCTNLGILPPDDPVYTRGPIVAGREIGKPGTHTRGGFLPEDHWLYGAGPIVAGRPIFGPKKKPHEDN